MHNSRSAEAARRSRLALCSALAVFLIFAPAAFGALTEQAELAGGYTNGPDFGGNGTGVSLSADGATALIGEPVHGFVAVYARSGTGWTEQAKLSRPQSGNSLGMSVALSADGDMAIATAEGGGAWVFTRSGTTWTLQTEEPLRPGEQGEESLDGFGNSVAISSDGSTAVVSAIARREEGFLEERRSPCAYVFKRSGSRWTRVAMLKPAGGSIYHYGGRMAPSRAAISGDGRTIVFGDPSDEGESGSSYVFEEAGGSWIERTKLLPDDETGPRGFGESVSISRDGSTIMVGSPYDAFGGGGAWAFTRSPAGSWHQQGQELFPPLEPLPGRFGESVALSGNGTAALIGSPGNGSREESPGAAWLWRRTGESWWLEQKLPEPLPHRYAETGDSVALSDEATTALMSSPRQGTEGEAWVFSGPATAGAEIPPAPPAAPAGGQWSQLGGNAARTATVDSPSLHPPFETVWSHAFPVPAGTQPTQEEINGKIIYGPAPEEFAGYPLLGNGLVYVVRTNSGVTGKTELDALSQKTGALVWSDDLVGRGPTLTALDGNRLFVSSLEEGVSAFDALSGQKLWNREVGGDEPITATEGTLYYVERGSEVIAVDETTGRTKWEDEMFNSTGAGPVVGEGRVYVMGGAEKNGVSGWAFDEKTGKKLWEAAPEALGDRGASWTTVLAEGRLWTANYGNLTEFNEWSPGGIVDPATGAQLGSYDAMDNNSPIIDGEDVIGLAEHWTCGSYPAPCTLQNTTLEDKDASGGVLWKFEGDGHLDSGLIRIGQDVYAGSATGNLYAVDENSGAEVWKAKMPAGFKAEGLNGPWGTPTGMAANGNMLAVVTGSTLTLMSSGGAPSEPPAPHAGGEPPAGSIEAPHGSSTTSSISSSGSSSSGSVTGGSSLVGRGGVAGTKSSKAACVLGGKAVRRLRDGALSVALRVRCSGAGRLSVAAGYRRREHGRAIPELVTLARKSARVRTGTNALSFTLAPGDARTLAAAHATLTFALELRS